MLQAWSSNGVGTDLFRGHAMYEKCDYTVPGDAKLILTAKSAFEFLGLRAGDAYTAHPSRLGPEFRPLTSVALLQRAPAPAASAANRLDRITAISFRWLQVWPLAI